MKKFILFLFLTGTLSSVMISCTDEEEKNEQEFHQVENAIDEDIAPEDSPLISTTEEDEEEEPIGPGEIEEDDI